MAYRDRPLDNPINWSFRIGRLFGIHLRVHVIFVLCAVVLIWRAIPPEGSGTAWSFGRVLVYALGGYAILFFIVLLHEFGHCFGCRHTGGEADEILMWPLGGLASVSPPPQPRAHLITAVAGPLVNLLICVVCSLLLILWMGSWGAVPWNPFHPFTPVKPALSTTTGQYWLLTVYGLSYLLLMFNLLPVFPLDGGRILQAWLWPRKGFGRSMEIATATGMVGAIGIFVVGVFLEDRWLLFGIAAFGYYTCWRARRMIREQSEYAAADVGIDFGQGYSFFDHNGEEERRPGFFERRRRRRAEQRAERARRRQEQHQKAVEEVLRKVSVAGMDSLSHHERHILQEETKRQRKLNAGSRNASHS